MDHTNPHTYTHYTHTILIHSSHYPGDHTDLIQANVFPPPIFMEHDPHIPVMMIL